MSRRQLNETLYKCDRCGMQQIMQDQNYPMQWRAMKRLGAYGAMEETLDLCGQCDSALSQFLAGK